VRACYVFACLAAIAGCKDEGNARPAPDKPVTNPQQAEAIKLLKVAIDERYSYRDRLGLDWNKLFAEATPELERATSRDQLVQGLVKLLAHAKDPHLDLIVDGKFVASDPTKIEWNFAVAQIKQKVTEWKHLGRCLSVGRVGQFAYVLVNGLEKGRCDTLGANWAAVYPALTTAPGMIMDLRGNAGGNEAYAWQIAGYFVDKPVPYVKSDTRDAKAPGGFTPAVVRTLQPIPGVERYAKPVVVLSGPYIMSSAESFLLMMRAAGATLVGSRSRGASANPIVVELGNGISARIPTWRAMLVDGTVLEGVGVVPDIEVPVTAAEVASGDKVIDAAVAELTKRLAK
jgi:hypothetical protein